MTQEQTDRLLKADQPVGGRQHGGVVLGRGGAGCWRSGPSWSPG